MSNYKIHYIGINSTIAKTDLPANGVDVFQQFLPAKRKLLSYMANEKCKWVRSIDRVKGMKVGYKKSK